MNLPPRDRGELLQRAQGLQGLTLGTLAEGMGWNTPEKLLHAKGWAGQLLEACLGATAGSRPVPDFEHLGIELKTIPVDSGGRVLESTFVCAASLLTVGRERWENSQVRRKTFRSFCGFLSAVIAQQPLNNDT